MLPKGGTMVKGCVTKCKHDDDGNVIGRANDNPFLDTRSYIVDFADGNTTKLTMNLIAESMYAQCDPDGNQYVLLDDLTDYRHDDTAVLLTSNIPPEAGKSVANGRMGLLLGNVLLTLRSPTQPRQLNLLSL